MVDTNLCTFIHYFISLICLCFTLYASTFLLFRRPKRDIQVSRTAVVIAYFWFTTTSSILLILLCLYVLIWWRPGQSYYNPMILYYLSGTATIYVNFVPVADFFLCLDRVFLVAYPIKYRETQRQCCACALFGTIFAIIISYILATNWFAFSSPTDTTTCAFYICLVIQLKYPLIMTYTKYVFCSLTVVTALTLMLLTRFGKTMQKDISKKINRSIMIVSFINVAFAFSPGIITNIVLEWWKVFLLPIIGDYNLTCICINISLCVFLYWRVFRKHFVKSKDLVPSVTHTVTPRPAPTAAPRSMMTRIK